MAAAYSPGCNPSTIGAAGLIRHGGSGWEEVPEVIILMATPLNAKSQLCGLAL
ncbi:hypothetical protein [Aquiflexum sp.]|uniref:hypothetical protein n=1 Tax=Aquiflexum sp. TaxID=1872584 RepID=UPI0035932514